MKKITTLIAAIAITTLTFAQNTYTLDKMHSRLSFSVFHMGISFIEGNFKTFDATLISTKEDFSDAKIEMTADVKSFNTEVEMRDNDLRDNWFEAAKFPTIVFKSTSFKKISGKKYKLAGNITMHGITKPIVFDVVYNGKTQSPFSKKNVVGFTITGKLKRSDFGVGKDALSTGVSEDVELKSNVELIVN
ncbi:MAG: YceI family protein [Bacteroidota bacterium]|nr:YceI family protein [Bacteroidota bacterium]